jgi:hypothetical protein
LAAVLVAKGEGFEVKLDFRNATVVLSPKATHSSYTESNNIVPPWRRAR